MAGKSLGPFPKTLSWHQIVRGLDGDADLAEQMLDQLRLRYDAFTRDPLAFRCIKLLVSLPIATRSSDPQTFLCTAFGMDVRGGEPDHLYAGLNKACPSDHPFKKAAFSTISKMIDEHAEVGLFSADPWSVWRAFDGAPFCDLARTFFAEVNAVCFAETLIVNGLRPDMATISRFAWETSLITRSFSVRWFKACAIDETPEAGSIRWYLGHCLGKIDLELSRESKDWIEPTGNPWRRKKLAPAPALEL